MPDQEKKPGQGELSPEQQAAQAAQQEGEAAQAAVDQAGADLLAGKEEGPKKATPELLAQAKEVQVIMEGRKEDFMSPLSIEEGALDPDKFAAMTPEDQVHHLNRMQESLAKGLEDAARAEGISSTDALGGKGSEEVQKLAKDYDVAAEAFYALRDHFDFGPMGY